MTEEEMIRQIAEPILKQLEKIEKELGNHSMPQLPQIKFVNESGEIGRRTRLRIWRLRRGGSSPFTRTTCKCRQLLR